MAFQRLNVLARLRVPDPDCRVSGWVQSSSQLLLTWLPWMANDLQQLAIKRPSGENRTAATPLRCPFNTIFCLYRTYAGLLRGGVASLGVSSERSSVTDSSRDWR